MSQDKEQLLREKGFEFFGAITASLSHEISNVLAIINELSGLLDDFFRAAERGDPLNVEKLGAITRRIASQVERGQGLVKRLNGFSHTVDGVDIVTSLNENVEAMTTLCRRFGELRRVDLTTNFPEESLKVESSAFDLQHVIFRCIDLILDFSKEGDVVQIDVEPRDGAASLAFTGCSNNLSTAEYGPKLEFLSVLVAEVNGTVEMVNQAGHFDRLVVSLPHPSRNQGTKHER